MTAFATLDPTCWTFAFHPSLADAEAAADAKDHLIAQSPECLSGLTAAEGAALFAATAAPLGIAPVKRFASRDVAARRIWENLVALSAAPAVPEAAAEPAPQPAVQPKAKAQPSAQKTPRGMTVAPKAEARACRAGTKQAILVDLLSRPGGASMAELRTALAPWQDSTIKSGLSWDMGHQKGYGIRTTHENGYQRWLATDYEGMGTFRADSHPDDVSEADKAALLADNLANGYNPAELFAVYHLVLPEGMKAPVPHTGMMMEAAE
ncbi:hypothetical protein [Paracoccus sp. SJTW-4]|uniref:hypothetical protein n=1 Tax=Paracoccus sp. SJTW-4 TaxID=3078428 RepID=UPI0039EAF130